MRPYWVKLLLLPVPTPLNLGVGVTAASEAGARDTVMAAVEGAGIVSVTPVSDVTDLDQRHVVPNMGNILVPGIWFPLGLT